MGVLATDDFVRADAADLGSNWDENSGYNAAGFDLVSNAATYSSGNGGSDLCETWNAVSFPNNQYAQITIGVTAAGGLGVGMGVVCRSATAAKTGYRLIGNESGWELARFVAGAFTALGSGSGDTFTTGDELRLEVRTNGANCDWTVMKNGVTVTGGTGSDTSPIASGRAGIAYSENQSAATIAAFEAGDFDEAAPLVMQRPLGKRFFWRGARRYG